MLNSCRENFLYAEMLFSLKTLYLIDWSDLLVVSDFGVDTWIPANSGEIVQ
jgi:hypothetical protein